MITEIISTETFPRDASWQLKINRNDEHFTCLRILLLVFLYNPYLLPLTTMGAFTVDKFLRSSLVRKLSTE